MRSNSANTGLPPGLVINLKNSSISMQTKYIIAIQLNNRAFKENQHYSITSANFLPNIHTGSGKQRKYFPLPMALFSNGKHHFRQKELRIVFMAWVLLVGGREKTHKKEEYVVTPRQRKVHSLD